MGDGGNKKTVAIVGVSSLLLVAMVVGVAIGVTKYKSSNGGGSGGSGNLATSTKAVKSICLPTEFRETCENALSKAAGDTSDPKELVKAGIKVAVDSLKESLKGSSTVKELANDELTSGALATCEELMNYSVDELMNSIDRITNFEMTKLGRFIEDLQVWLSAALTYENTCLDGFKNTTGNAGEKMKSILKTSIELTSNGVDMIAHLNKMLGGTSNEPPENSSGGGHNDRKLFANDQHHIPAWISEEKRKLLEAPPPSIKPNLVVAQDGTGNFKTITQALENVPKRQDNATFIIYVKQGIYNEQVVVGRSNTHIMMYGDGPLKTRVTGKKNFKLMKIQTQQTSTFAVVGAEFMCKEMGFENTAGPEGHQAVALRVQSDMSVFFNCHMDGHQDTLYVQTHRQFFRDCQITGTIDFIFGNAMVVFQNCKIVVRKPGDDQSECMVTAHGRMKKDEPTGIVLQGCSITGDPLLRTNPRPVRAFLGRPWKPYARAIVMQTFIDTVIDPEGWAKWAGESFEKTCWFSEFGNTGPGSNLATRAKYSGIKPLDAQGAGFFTPQGFFKFDLWITNKALPYDPQMMRTV